MGRKQKRLLGAIVLCMVLFVAGYTQREDLKALAWDLKYSIEFRQIKQEILEQYPQLKDENTSDFEKTSLLRDWAYGKYAYQGETKNRFDYWWGKEGNSEERFVNLTRAFEKFDGAGYCAGAAAYLALVYDVFGYEAISVDYFVEKGASHVITLVKILDNNEEKWVFQDATFNRSYVNLGGNPLDCFTMTQMLNKGRDLEIYELFGDTAYRYQISDAPLSVSATKNIEEIEPGTTDFYCYPTDKYIEKSGRYGIPVDMRQPRAFEVLISEKLEKDMIILGRPAKGIYCYLYPYDYYVSNTDEASIIVSRLQQIAGYEPPAA